MASRVPVLRRLGGDKPTRLRAYNRSVVNLGISLGALAAGVALQVDTRTAYLALVLGNGVTFLLAAAVLLALPSIEPLPVPVGQRNWAGLRDRPFLALTFLSGVLSLQDAVLAFALPLWVAGDTTAPRWLIGVLIFVNTALVVCFQVRATRGVTTPRLAARAARVSSFVLLVAFILIGLAAGLPGWAAIVVLLVAVSVLTLAELLHAAASFELTIGLAPSHAQGEYAGIFSTGGDVAHGLGPAVLGVLCLGLKLPGWLLLGAILVLAGLAMSPVAQWAERTRPVLNPATTEETAEHIDG